MKKVKMLFIVAASITGIGGAFATNSRMDCTQDPQFKDLQGTPVTPGFICSGNLNTCTYHRVNGVLTKCKAGHYTSPPALNLKK